MYRRPMEEGDLDLVIVIQLVLQCYIEVYPVVVVVLIWLTKTFREGEAYKSAMEEGDPGSAGLWSCCCGLIERKCLVMRYV